MAGQVFLASFLACVLLAQAEILPETSKDKVAVPYAVVHRAVLDKFFDYMRPYLSEAMIRYGMEPMELADFSEGVLPLPGKLKGSIDFTNGWVQEMSNVRRAKHVIATYSQKVIVLDMDLGWRLLDFNYEYLFKYLLYKRTGDLYGRFHDIDMKVLVSVDLENYKVTLNQIKFLRVGKFELKLEGNIIDPLLNIATKMITTVFRRHVLKSVEYRSLLIFKKMISDFNDQIPRPDRVKAIDNLHKLVIAQPHYPLNH